MNAKPNIEQLAEAVGVLQDTQKKIAPMAAKSLIDAIKNNNVENDFLQLIGILHGQGLKAEDLILAIQNELEK
ncbi:MULTISPECIES: hypothetical protein [Pseudoalteromonas]|uniref:hypothetical protein n=1 Tax=Pseudoalteromonas TaxID=53246 RepID=UPI001583D0CF|nr:MULTISPECIES: hypothetical protein [Pseudoalteromonas]MDI4654216.1 hypothetical protein [Pseudoalteromonas shioyasakiensis]NUJ40170.1 hypothetical protein [Pseudoalteromonas sp. 0303]